jgi:hypothetical protein
MLLSFLCRSIRGGSDPVAKRTQSSRAGDMPLIRRKQLGRETVRTVEAVLNVHAAHEPDALAFML